MLEVLQLEKYTDKNVELNKELGVNLVSNKESFNNIVSNILKRGIDYGVKALDISKDSDGIINSIKEIVKSKDLKEIVNSSVNVSLSQALENQKGDLNVLKNLNEFKDMALKGGLRFLLSAGVEILFNKTMKLNLFKPIIEKLVKNVKNFVMSNSFIQKLSNGVNKILEKTSDFKQICEKWYKAYDEFDISLINDIAKELESKKDTIQNDTESIRENDIIQNMTKLINAKKDKLSQLQLQICNDL